MLKKSRGNSGKIISHQLLVICIDKNIMYHLIICISSRAVAPGKILIFRKTYVIILSWQTTNKEIRNKFKLMGIKKSFYHIPSSVSSTFSAQLIYSFLCGRNCSSTVRQPEFPVELQFCRCVHE